MDNDSKQLLLESGVDKGVIQKIDRLQQAAHLVKEGKLRPEVYQELKNSLDESVVKSRTRRLSNFKNSTRKLSNFKNLSTKSINMSLGKPILEGYLDKKMHTTPLKLAIWKRAYFKLYKHALVAYKAKESDIPDQVFELDADCVVSDVEKIKGAKRIGCSFSISRLNNKIILCAGATDEKRFWQYTIDRMIVKFQDDAACFDIPVLVDRPHRTIGQIQDDYEARLSAYRKSFRNESKYTTNSPEQYQKVPVNNNYEGANMDSHLQDTTAEALPTATKLDEEKKEHEGEMRATEADSEVEKLRQEVKKWKKLARANAARADAIKREFQAFVFAMDDG